MKFVVKAPEEKICVLKPGMRFKLMGEEYILATIGKDTHFLVSLTDGNRWSNVNTTMQGIAEQLNDNGFTLVNPESH